MKYIKKHNDLLVIPEDIFSLPQTLDCGQAFRWEKTENNKWHGVVKGTPLTVYETADGIVFENTTEEQFNTIWKDYFDFNTDYKKSENPSARTCIFLKPWTSAAAYAF